ncbi:MAG: aspartate-semialdehyde dehydrogenase [Spirochaetes bacterium]|nr:aspartate-semialdehyde dehydrogenase [Spirochaetota bacterium]MBU0955440.1 aspartate-semialdehyde dehydrogenase [Spirochaetota bacterium]
MTKIPVAILGATGAVGQRLVSLLFSHPWFDPVLLCASERSAGRPYAEAVRWVLADPMPEQAASMKVAPCTPDLKVRLVFSALDADVATKAEAEWARAGVLVVSNTRCYRMDKTVPLIIPEVNGDHLQLLKSQDWPGKGGIVTNPNCSTIGMVLALKPLADSFGLDAVHVVTMQAASGAGYPGVPSLDLLDNMVPYISGEEDKLETEPLKILGHFDEAAAEKGIQSARIAISASCNRVPVSDGHSMSVSVRLHKKVTEAEILSVWRQFRCPVSDRQLPSMPAQPLVYLDLPDRPQPRLDRNTGDGMSVVLGRLRPCALFGWKFSLLSHNTIRGAAGGTILVAEQCVQRGFLD